MLEVKGLGNSRKLLIERYAEFREVLQKEGANVYSAGTETHNGITYFRVVLKK